MITEQLQNFLLRLPPEYGQLAPENQEVLTVFPSALELDREQESNLTEHCLDEIERLSEVLGRNLTMDDGWMSGSRPTEAQDSSASGSFFGKRELHDMVYACKVDWRKWLYGALFAHTNLHIPISRRLLQQMIARAQKAFFGTEPWYTIQGEGVEDEETSKAVDRFTKWGFSKSNSRDALDKSIELAFIRGEGIIKGAWSREVDYYETYALVAIGPDGEPLRSELDGEYVTPDDVWVPAEDGSMTLKRDLETLARSQELAASGAQPLVNPTPGALPMVQAKVKREKLRFEGLDLSVVAFKDFLIDRYSKDVQRAATVIHLYDMPAIELAHNYLERVRASGNDTDAPRVIDLLRTLSSSDRTPKSSRQNPRMSLGEGSPTGRPGGAGDILESSRHAPDPIVQIAECYLHFDANNDGILENIVVLVDVKNRRPIFYDYLANVTPDGLRPFHITRVNPVDGRWHGVSQLEIFQQMQDMIDVFVNRINLAQTKAGRIDLVDPTKVMEGQGGGKIEINGNQTFTLIPGASPDDFYKAIYLNEIKSEHLWRFVEFLLQVCQNMSGVTNANDAQAAGMQTAETATGINSLADSGQELFLPYLSQLEPGIRSATTAGIHLQIANMSEEASYRYHDGQIGASVLAKLKKQDVADFDFDLDIELTSFRNENQVGRLLQAQDVLNRFAAQPSEQHLAGHRPVVMELLQAMQIRNAETVIDNIEQGTMMMIQMAQQAAAAAAEQSQQQNGPTVPPFTQ